MPVRESTPKDRKKGYRKRKPAERVREEMKVGPGSSGPTYQAPSAGGSKGRLQGFKAEERAALKTRMDAAIAARDAARTAGDRAAFAAAQDQIKAIREERSGLIAQKKEAKKEQSARGAEKKAAGQAKKDERKAKRGSRGSGRERKPKE